MSNTSNVNIAPAVKHTKPIFIPIPHHRERSASLSDSASDCSNSPPLQTPVSSNSPKIGNAASASPPSPILSYFFANPPKSASAAAATTSPGGLGSLGRSFVAKSPGTEAVVEEDEECSVTDLDHEPMLVKHARRLSTGWNTAPRLVQPSVPVSGAQQERGAALLRRLSLGGALSRPQVNVQPPSAPPQMAPSAPVPEPPKQAAPVARKARRATLGVSGEGRPRRAPSPMGERMLKGHFDGFN